MARRFWSGSWTSVRRTGKRSRAYVEKRPERDRARHGAVDECPDEGLGRLGCTKPAEAASRRRANVRVTVVQPPQNRRRGLGAGHVTEPEGSGGAAPATGVAERADLSGVCLRPGEVLADPLPSLAAHTPREPADRLGKGRPLLGVQPPFLDLVAVDQRERQRTQPRLQLVPSALRAGERHPACDEGDEEQHAEDGEDQRADAEDLEHRYRRPSTAWTRALSSRGLNGFRM